MLRSKLNKTRALKREGRKENRTRVAVDWRLETGMSPEEKQLRLTKED